MLKVAADLLDWGVGTTMGIDEIKAETVSWLSDKGNSEQVEFSNKFALVYDASTEEFENQDNWPDVAELVNPRGDETTVYLLVDGRYMDRINAIYIYDGEGTWTDEAGVRWNEKVK